MVLDDFTNIDSSDLKMPMIVVYNPITREYPRKYVARLFDINSPTNCVVIKDTYEEIFTIIPPNMTRLGRNALDVPEIIETWM